MEIVDLSREIFHRTQTHPSHPPVVMTVWNDHSEQKRAGDTVFTSKALSIACSDLSHVPLKHAATVEEVEAAVRASGQEIRKGDTVLILMGTNARLLGKPG